MLKLKAFHQLKVNLVKRKTQNKIERPKIHATRKLFIVALIKK